MRAIATGPITMNIAGKVITAKQGDLLDGQAAVAAVNAGKAKAEPDSAPAPERKSKVKVHR